MNAALTRLKGLMFAAAIAAALVITGAGAPAIYAQTPNVTVGAGQVVTIPILIAGQRTGNVTAVARFALPFPGDVLGVAASARASGGTSPTLTVDVMDDGVSILSAPVAVTAGAVAQATLASTVPAVADESVMTVNLAITGTSPTWDDIMVLITVSRK